MAVFTTREAAREFIEGDPFVTNALVSGWRLVGNDAFIWAEAFAARAKLNRHPVGGQV
jgi:hypothetical protein